MMARSGGGEAGYENESLAVGTISGEQGMCMYLEHSS